MSDKRIEFESCGLKGWVNNPPANEAEWNALAGPNGYQLLDAGLDQVKFHGFMGDFRSDIMDAVEKEFGVVPLQEQKRDAQKKPVVDSNGNPVMVTTEKPAAYLDRVAASLGKTTNQLFQHIADEWSAKAEFASWLKIKPRGEGGPSVGKRDTANAIEILADPARLARTKAKMAEFGIIVPDSPTAEQYALCIRELRNRLEASAIA